MYGYGDKDNFDGNGYNQEYEPSLFTIRDRITLINDASLRFVYITLHILFLYIFSENICTCLHANM